MAAKSTISASKRPVGAAAFMDSPSTASPPSKRIHRRGHAGPIAASGLSPRGGFSPLEMAEEDGESVRGLPGLPGYGSEEQAEEKDDACDEPPPLTASAEIAVVDGDQEEESVRQEIFRHAAPLIQRLRGPKDNWPTKKDFLEIPTSFACKRWSRLQSVADATLSGVKSLKGMMDDLNQAGARAHQAESCTLPVAVALYCLSQVTGFPEKLIHQVWVCVKAACFHKDHKIHLRGDLAANPRAPGVGVAAPGSKKTPVQVEMLVKVFMAVLGNFPFLGHDTSTEGECLLWEGGNNAAFIKQMRLNSGYLVMMIEELINFFDVSYPTTGNTNPNNVIVPTNLLPLRTGNGLSKSLASDLGNKIKSTQVAMSFMAQEDVVKKVFCSQGMWRAQIFLWPNPSDSK